MNTRQPKHIINEEHFDLAPVLQAAKNKDREAMQDFFNQGYALCWQDHLSQKTLLFALGETLDVETIHFVLSLQEKTGYHDLDDAFEGAAFANKSLAEISKIAPIDLKYPYIMLGAARGQHHELLDEAIKSYAQGNNDKAMNIHFAVRGAATANDMITVNTFTSRYYRDRNNFILREQIKGAAQGGHIAAVEALLQTHEAGGAHEITDEGGYSTAYKQAMYGAARAGNIGLIARLFLILDQQEWPCEHPMELIIHTIETAAFYGHYNLVFDLIARAKLYDSKDITLARVITSALRGAMQSNRFNLASKLFSLGATAQNLFDAVFKCHTVKTQEDLTKDVFKLIKVLDHPKLAYEIAHLHDAEKYHGNINLIPLVIEMYGLPSTSEAGRKVYFANEGLKVWLNHHDKIHINPTLKAPTCNHDVAIMVAEIATEQKIPATELRECRHLAKAFATLKPPAKAAMTPSTIVDIIRNKLLNELDAYLNSSMKAHTQKAKALYSCVRHLYSIGSIYLLIKHQLQLMQGEPATSKQKKATSPFKELARTPTRTGHGFFNSVFARQDSFDFLTRLERCIAIIESYRAEPEIDKILADTNIYEQPMFKKTGFIKPAFLFIP